MKLSLFSVGYAGYWGQHQLDVFKFITRAAELGYDAVMIAGKRPHLSPLDATDEHLSAVKAAGALLSRDRRPCGLERPAGLLRLWLFFFDMANQPPPT